MRAAAVAGMAFFCVSLSCFGEPPSGAADGIALYHAGRLREAAAYFDEILQASPNDPEANYYRGRVAIDQNDWNRALVLESRALSHDPNDARYQNAIGEAFGIAAQSVSGWSKLGYARKCLAAFSRAIALDPTNIDYRFDLIEFYRQAPPIAGGGMDKAFAEAAEIAKLDPLQGHLAYAKLYRAQHKFDLALAEVNAALKLNPDSADAQDALKGLP